MLPSFEVSETTIADKYLAGNEIGDIEFPLESCL